MSVTTHWGSPPPDVFHSLAPGSVHVWQASLNDSAERAARFRCYLSEDELTRADRYRSPHPQYQFLVTRGILRMLLSHYVGIPTAQIHFETQAHGKPKLIMPSSIPIQFNVSHTRGMAVIAFARQHAVGIDVEWIDRKIHDGDIAERYFSAQESAYLASLPPRERTHQFFGFWTCKEAYLKMQGQGITGGLAQCELMIDPEKCEVGMLRWKQHDQGGVCSLFQMRVGEEHVGAVATACSAAQISYWNWQDAYLA